MSETVTNMDSRRLVKAPRIAEVSEARGPSGDSRVRRSGICGKAQKDCARQSWDTRHPSQLSFFSTVMCIRMLREAVLLSPGHYARERAWKRRPEVPDPSLKASCYISEYAYACGMLSC